MTKAEWIEDFIAGCYPQYEATIRQNADYFYELYLQGYEDNEIWDEFDYSNSRNDGWGDY